MEPQVLLKSTPEFMLQNYSYSAQGTIWIPGIKSGSVTCKASVFTVLFLWPLIFCFVLFLFCFGATSKCSDIAPGWFDPGSSGVILEPRARSKHWAQLGVSQNSNDNNKKPLLRPSFTFESWPGAALVKVCRTMWRPCRRELDDRIVHNHNHNITIADALKLSNVMLVKRSKRKGDIYLLLWRVQGNPRDRSVAEMSSCEVGSRRKNSVKSFWICLSSLWFWPK